MTEESTKRTARHEEEAEKRSEGQKIEDLDVREEDLEAVKGGGNNLTAAQTDPGDDLPH